MAEIEVFQGTADSASYQFVVRDSEPPRRWYGARRAGDGWRFEPLSDERLVALSDQAQPAAAPAAAELAAAFRAAVAPNAIS